jgi:hypothetical protein
VSGVAVIGHDETKVGTERGAHERLPLERRLGEDDRLQDEVEQEDGLADRGPDRLVPFLAGSMPITGLGAAPRVADESIERKRPGAEGIDGAAVRHEAVVPMGLVEPAQDELGGSESTLEPGEAALGSHGSPSGSSPD